MREQSNERMNEKYERMK